MDTPTTVLFFDVTVSGVKRFPAQISEQVRARSRAIRTVAGYLLEDLKPGQSVGALDELEQVTGNFREWIQEHSPDIVVLFSHRVPDLILIAACRDLDVPTVMVQHGIYVDMDYGPGAFFSEKALRYLRLMPELAKESDLPLARLLRPWDLQQHSDRADHALVYGAGYVAYFGEHYGYSPDDCTVVGYPDYDGWEPGEPESGVCYIAQSVVEDGRVARSQFEDFVRILCEIAERTALSVKLHPRSDLSLYEPLSDLSVPMVRHRELPLRRIYISHSTTLLAKAFRISPHVLLWGFPNVAVPAFFREWAVTQCDSRSELLDEVARLQRVGERDNGPSRAAIEYWFEHNESGAWQSIAQSILSMAAE